MPETFPIQPREYFCENCKIFSFKIVYTDLESIRPPASLKDKEILGQTNSCPDCGQSQVYVQRFWQDDLPKSFMTNQYEYLLENLSPQALMAIAQHLFLLSAQVQSIHYYPKFILRSARLGSKEAAEHLIKRYELGYRPFKQNFLRAIAWAKRRYDYKNGEQVELFERLVDKYKKLKREKTKNH